MTNQHKVQEIVLRVIQDILHESEYSAELPQGTLGLDVNLHSDLGLTSFDLARLIAILDMQLHADPFAKDVPFTSVRTIQDLINAYLAVYKSC